MRLLFQGDSITDAFRKPDEMNPAYQLGNGYVFIAASRLAFEMPAVKWEFVNRGFSGNTVSDLLNRWQCDVLDLMPDVLTLLVGVNDTIVSMQENSGIDDASFAAVYRMLLEAVRKSNSRVRLIVMEPFLLETGGVQAAWRAHLRARQEAICKIASENGAAFVPLQSIFDDAAARSGAQYWCYDGIHPTHAGFQLVAEAWLRVFHSTVDLKTNALCPES